MKVSTAPWSSRPLTRSASALRYSSPRASPALSPAPQRRDALLRTDAACDHELVKSTRLEKAPASQVASHRRGRATHVLVDHAAFDSYIIGVTPDLEVTVRLDVLEEIDGPMLQHGLQGFQGRRIHVPRADHLKPNRDFLAERYALFRRAS